MTGQSETDQHAEQPCNGIDASLFEIETGAIPSVTNAAVA
jgi:hypothetical protein